MSKEAENHEERKRVLKASVQSYFFKNCSFTHFANKKRFTLFILNPTNRNSWCLLQETAFNQSKVASTATFNCLF